MALKLSSKTGKRAKRTSEIAEVDEVAETPETESIAEIWDAIEELRESINGAEEVLRQVCKTLEIDLV